MTNDELIDRVAALAGPLRAETWRVAARFILEHNCKQLVETGCYRGAASEGQSTLILAWLSEQIVGTLDTYDISADSINIAQTLLRDFNFTRGLAAFHTGDSVSALSFHSFPIRFAYLDSLDYGELEKSQRHALAEVGAIYGKMLAPCAILLDDYIVVGGGKTHLAAQFLQERGWTLAAQGYQLLWTKE